MNEKKKGRRVAVLIRNLSPHVRDHFKALCARRGSSMNKELEKFMRQQIQQDQQRLSGVAP